MVSDALGSARFILESAAPEVYRDLDSGGSSWVPFRRSEGVENDAGRGYATGGTGSGVAVAGPGTVGLRRL